MGRYIPSINKIILTILFAIYHNPFVFSKDICIEKIEYNVFGIMQSTMKLNRNYHDSTKAESKVEIFRIENQTEEDFVVFLTRPRFVCKSIESKISIFLHAYPPGVNSLCFREAIESFISYGEGNFCDKNIDPWMTIKLIKPREIFFIVCSSSIDRTDLDFGDCITSCKASIFFSCTDKTISANLRNERVLFPYEVLALTL